MVWKKLKNDTKFIVSIDDYHPLNLKIGKIIEDAGFMATFYLETGNKAALGQIKPLAEMFHDIGGHTISHPSDLKACSLVEAAAEIESCKMMIEKLYGDEVTSFAYPRGRYNQEIIELVKKAGYRDARTTRVLNVDPPLDYYQCDTSVHMYDGRKEYNGRKWDDIGKDLLHLAIEKHGHFHIWGHGYELERDNSLGRFIDFLNYAKQYVDKNTYTG